MSVVVKTRARKGDAKKNKITYLLCKSLPLLCNNEYLAVDTYTQVYHCNSQVFLTISSISG